LEASQATAIPQNTPIQKTTTFAGKMHQELPIGVQSFPELRSGNYIYVDKTELCHRLISRGKYYFLSRPRRFGKSLLISTLNEIFTGNRQLFEGLWIHDKIDWEPRPVIWLDFTQISKISPALEDGIGLELLRIADGYGVTLASETNAGRLQQLIRELGKEQKVAILVDEYDKPLIDNIDDQELANRNRQTLKDMYSVIKGNDAHIAFLMLTGVTKFSQVSIFSDLNNLYDITLAEEFSTLLGYTQEELTSNFAGYLDALQLAMGMPFETMLAKVKEWYNGYSWDGKHLVYNPFSILNLLRKQRFEDFWFATGTPTFLMKLIKKENYGVFDLENIEISAWAFNHFDVSNLEIKSLLFQTGYLTIKRFDAENETVTLDFPNKEVAKAFSFHLLSAYAEKGQEKTDALILKIHKLLADGSVEGFISSMQAMFADIAYPILPTASDGIENMEKYYHSMFFLLLRLLGYRVQVEVFTNLGRMDAVIATAKFIYVVEFKLGSATAALAQLKAKHYHEKYLDAGKKIFLLGIGFDTQTRNIGAFLVEEIG
jgi:Predicted AAA-ATPase/PD-(D/E)XK nuclease superfamily